MSGKIIAFGHRGAMGYEPENTLLSFTTAVNMGVDGIELDVYRSNDDQVIVSHSDSLEINGQLYRFTKLDLAEIKKITLDKDQTVPTLEEVFIAMEGLRDGQLKYSIDLKDVRDIDAYHAVLDKFGVVDRVFTCFESRLFIKKAQRQFPELAYVYSTHVNPAGVVEDMDKIEASLVSAVNMPAGELKKELTDEFHARGVKSFCWDVNDEDRMREVAGWGVDAMYSNYPDKLVAALSSLD
jgi:glycerophosphoryl diester phosphodiesterase